MTKIEYWCVSQGEHPQFCSKHKSATAAEKAAKLCEKRGGWTHRIFMAIEVLRPIGRKKK